MISDKVVVVTGGDRLIGQYFSQEIVKHQGIGVSNSDDLNGTLICFLSDMSAFVIGQNIVVSDGFSL
ncbi:hypothetical protein CF386_03185 [Paraphotobacterium marinum]|uniref:Short-chain dehydrogenase n=1 Tax=Paraphotobacterium marinum TaxID=1755811 RepID=A0A220VCP0_9GAMM|nr:hypothetical protein [Paraphotobacterium marinum]ASK78109.1 hypothetical protein CF386_03185 [Paraphotobacterium marinum]